MDHLIDTNLSYEIKALCVISHSYQFISEVIYACGKFELVSANRKIHIELPAWINRSFVIYWRVDNANDNYRDSYCTNLVTDLPNALYVELCDIYRGLSCLQKSIYCANLSDKHMCLLRAERHLLVAVELCKSHERILLNNCNKRFAHFISNCFIKNSSVVIVHSEADNGNVELNNKRISDRQNTRIYDGCNEEKSLLYSRSVESYEQKLDNCYRLSKETI